jgi:nuclear migration protein JNM1
MKSLTADLEKLEEKREQARQRALLDSEDSPLVIETDETARKIDALYALLETIDKVAPVVPGILDRLRGMSIVHADAAGVATGLKEVEVRIGSVQREIKEWNEALERVESEMRESGERVNGTANRVEKVVRDLEDQVKKLEL